MSDEASNAKHGALETAPVTAIAAEPMVLERRMMLLKGLGKGSAVLGAAIPIQTLAAPAVTVTDGRICSVSGTQSAVHSQSTTAATCQGYSPGWWGQVKKNSSPPAPRRAWPVQYKTKISGQPFASTLTKQRGGVPTRFEVASLPEFSNTDLRHWLCAWLNAQGAPAAWNFPYSAAAVIDFYLQNDQKALTFFKDYMETHLPT
jgi:hypothetical protein